MYLINVAGQARAGKDTLADRLLELLQSKSSPSQTIWKSDQQWSRSAWARGVKKVYCDTFGRDADFIEEWKVKLDPPPGFDMNVRKSLQFIGDGFRQITDTVWIDMALRENKPLIISDCRYINEFKRTHKEGGLNILVGRPDMLNDDPNPSESQIRPFVDWALWYCKEPVTIMPHMCGGDYPEHMDMFNIFIRNDGTLDQFYSNIEEYIWPEVLAYDLKRRSDEHINN